MSINLRVTASTWHAVATFEHPLKLRLPDGTWETFADGGGNPLYLRMPDGTWKEIARSGSGTLTPHGNYSYRDYPYATSWLARKNDFQLDRGPNTDPSVEASGTSNRFQTYASCETGQGWSGDADGTQIRYVKREASWLSLPLAHMREYVETTFAPGPTFVSATITFQLYGLSVEKNQLRWMNQFNTAQTTIGRYSGSGYLIYQGEVPGTFRESNDFRGLTRDVPVIRNKAFNRDIDGQLVWNGQLNNVGFESDDHGINIGTGIQVVHDIPAADMPEAAQYTMWVTETPVAPAFDANDTHAWFNFFYADPFITFNYRT